MFSVKERLEFFDPVEVHYRRTMNPKKFFRIELTFHRAQSLAHHPRAFSSMEMDVFGIRLQPINLACMQERDSPIRADDDAIEILSLGAYAFEERPYLEMLLLVLLRINTFLRVPQGRLETHLIEWFEKIVERMKLEGADGIGFVSRGEDNFRQMIELHRVEHREPIHLRHLNVEENKVRFFFADHGRRFSAVAAFRDDLDV